MTCKEKLFVMTCEERFHELEKRVAALEAAADPVQDDAGCGFYTESDKSYIQVSPETEPPAPDPAEVAEALADAREGRGRTIDEILAEPEPQRWWANRYSLWGPVYFHPDESEADKYAGMSVERLVLVEADAYDRLKAELEEVKSLASYEAAVQWRDKYHVTRAERDVLRDFVEAVRTRRINEWLISHRIGEWGAPLSSDAKRCLELADEAGRKA